MYSAVEGRANPKYQPQNLPHEPEDIERPPGQRARRLSRDSVQPVHGAPRHGVVVGDYQLVSHWKPAGESTTYATPPPSVGAVVHFY